MKNMKKYDADHDVIKAFRGTGLELVVVALLNGCLQAMGANEDQAMNWVKENVQAFLPDTLIRGICVGNEVLRVDCSRLMEPFAYDVGFHGLVSSTANSSSADLSFPESIFADSVSGESISANSSSEYSLLLSLKHIGAQGWSRSQYLMLPSSAAALLLLLR